MGLLLIGAGLFKVHAGGTIGALVGIAALWAVRRERPPGPQMALGGGIAGAAGVLLSEPGLSAAVLGEATGLGVGGAFVIFVYGLVFDLTPAQRAAARSRRAVAKAIERHHRKAAKRSGA